MRKYRVVTNGIDFRIQWLGKTCLLRRPKWYWLMQCYNGNFIPSFISEEFARVRIKETVRYDRAASQGYLPVK